MTTDILKPYPQQDLLWGHIDPPILFPLISLCIFIFVYVFLVIPDQKSPRHTKLRRVLRRRSAADKKLTLKKWRILLRLSIRQVNKFIHANRSLVRSAWITIFMLAVWIFYNTARMGFLLSLPLLFKLATFLFIPFFIFGITAALEGIEVAYAELKDKEESQIRNRDSLFYKIRILGESFSDAREWCIAFLAVAATLIVEGDSYRIPFYGTFNSVVARWTMTILLTIIPLVWIAQSPAKALASKNSINFIDLALVRIAYTVAIPFFYRLTSIIRLDSPTHYLEQLIQAKMNSFHRGRNLPPGEMSFFTDSLKRYGYASLDRQEEFTINDNGSCDFVMTDIVYIGDPTLSYVRDISVDSSFASDPTVKCDLFEIDAVGESVQDQLKIWIDGARGIPEERVRLKKYPRLTIASKKVKLFHEESQRERGEKITLRLDFNAKMPEARRVNGISSSHSAVLMRVVIEGKTSSGTYKGSDALGTPTQLALPFSTAILSTSTQAVVRDYHFYKMKTPCFAARMKMKMRSDRAPSSAIFSNVEYAVTFDRREHPSESQTFRNWQTDEAGVSPDGSELLVLLNSPLPGAVYRITWDVKARQSVASAL